MSLSSRILISKIGSKPSFPLFIVSSNKKEALNKLKSFGVSLFNWQEESLEENKLNRLEVSQGRLGVLILNKKIIKNSSPGFFQKDIKTICRDEFGDWISFIKDSNYSLIALKTIGTAAIEGLGLGVSISSYNYKKNNKIKVFIDLDEKIFSKGLSLGNSVNTARWLVDSPPNKLNPESFKNIIIDQFKKAPKFEVKVLNKAQLKKAGYGLISAVGQGSETGPYLVHVSYKGKALKKESIAMVGKGITFDTGGLDLKPSKFMRWMKKDMGGSASVFGIAQWVRETKPKENFDFIFAIAENSVSKEAVRPSDIMKAKNGLTVEMHNTDAEGRLALASGFNYLSSLNKKFSYCINIATLTGAIKVGLGDKVAGLFSNDLKFAKNLTKAGEAAGDPLWMMPMPYWTKDNLQTSHVADVVNALDGYGGAITAAEFLKLFVPKNTPWCHLDTYAWTDSKRDAFVSKGATGQGVQAVCEWIKSLK